MALLPWLVLGMFAAAVFRVVCFLAVVSCDVGVHVSHDYGSVVWVGLFSFLYDEV